MRISLIVLFLFFSLSSAMAVVALVLKDLLWARSAVGSSGPVGSRGSLRLRRLPRASQQGPPTGPVASFDRWFLRLVRETGLPISATQASLLLVLCGAVLGATVFLWNEHPLLGTIGGFVGMSAGLAYLVAHRARRVKQLQDQLPAALDMLARGIRAGHSIDEAFEMVGRQSPEPLAAEFRICAGQMAMGLSMPAVMRSLVSRVELFDVRIFTTTLTVHRQTGGNIAMVLERLAAVIRDRLNCRRQLRATTGAGRISAILIAAIGPFLFVYLCTFHAQYVRAMTESPVGQTVLVLALALEIVGLIWTARLLKPIY